MSEALGAADTSHVDPVEEHREPGRVHLDGLAVAARDRKLKSAALEAFAIETEAATIEKVVNAGDVTWLANANLAATMTFGVSGITPSGSMTHDVAVKWIDAMNKADGGKGYLGSKAWQLPPTITPDPGCSSPQDTYGYGCTGSPLGRLYYTVLGLKAGERVVAAPDTTVGPFRNVEPYLYWSCHLGGDGKCSPNADDPVKGMGWSYSLGNGFEGTTTRENALYVTAYHAGKGK